MRNHIWKQLSLTLISKSEYWRKFENVHAKPKLLFLMEKVSEDHSFSTYAKISLPHPPDTQNFLWPISDKFDSIKGDKLWKNVTTSQKLLFCEVTLNQVRKALIVFILKIVWFFFCFWICCIVTYRYFFEAGSKRTSQQKICVTCCRKKDHPILRFQPRFDIPSLTAFQKFDTKIPY